MKILILGAGNAQIDLIDYCHSAGLEVYCCSYSSSDPGASRADHFAHIDIVDQKGIEEYFRNQRIDLIYSVGSDVAVPVFSAVAERTGTPSLVLTQAARICCDKSLMRDALREKAFTPSYLIGTSPEALIKEAEDLRLFPAEVKPTDSQGQRGVSRADCAETLSDNIKKAMSYSRKKEVILEEFIAGDEVSVNAYLYKGEVIFSMLSDREAWPDYPGGIIHRHHISSKYEGSEVHRRIQDMIKEVVRALKLTDGPVYFQIIIRDEHPYLIEVTPRLDGCHLWRLIQEACGVNLLEMTMNHLLYGDPLAGQLNNPNRTVLPDCHGLQLEFFCMPPGERFDSTCFEEEESEKKPLFQQMYYRNGDTIRPVNGYMEKCGYRICRY